MNAPSDKSRRMFIQTACAGAAAMMGAGAFAAPDELLKPATSPATGSARPDPWRGLKVGVATYSLRKLPTEAAIKAIGRVGLRYASLKDFHLPLKSTAEERKAVAAQFQAAGIALLSCGVITTTGDEASVRGAFEYARDIGVGVIVAKPTPDSLPLIDKLVKEFDIKLAIHNHGPEDKVYPSPYDALKLIERLDPRIGLCLDIGHTARAGLDVADVIRKVAPRLFDAHMKDVSTAQGRNPAVEIEVGRGVLDVPAIMQALVEIKFPGHVGFEHERDAADPLPGLAESVGYVKGVLATIGG